VHTFQEQNPPARPKNYIQVCLVYMFCIFPYSFTAHIEYTVQYCIRFIRPSLNATPVKYFLKSLLCLLFIKYVGIRSGSSSMCQICKKYNILVLPLSYFFPRVYQERTRMRTGMRGLIEYTFLRAPYYPHSFILKKFRKKINQSIRRIRDTGRNF